jgi:hypothetical protein
MLELSGSAKKNKARMEAQGRGTEPQPDPEFGNVPRSLTPTQKKYWAELTDLVAPGVLTKADRWLVRLTVLMAEKVFDGTATSSQTATFERCLARLGMSPADRSKIKVSTPDAEPEADPFAEFAGPEQVDADKAVN